MDNTLKVAHGTVKFFNKKASFGFIRLDSGAEVYVHAKHLENEIGPGDRVACQIRLAKRGWEAIAVVKS